MANTKNDKIMVWVNLTAVQMLKLTSWNLGKLREFTNGKKIVILDD